MGTEGQGVVNFFSPDPFCSFVCLLYFILIFFLAQESTCLFSVCVLCISTPFYPIAIFWLPLGSGNTQLGVEGESKDRWEQGTYAESPRAGHPP